MGRGADGSLGPLHHARRAECSIVRDSGAISTQSKSEAKIGVESKVGIDKLYANLLILAVI